MFGVMNSKGVRKDGLCSYCLLDTVCASAVAEASLVLPSSKMHFPEKPPWLVNLAWEKSAVGVGLLGIIMLLGFGTHRETAGRQAGVLQMGLSVGFTAGRIWPGGHVLDLRPQ